MIREPDTAVLTRDLAEYRLAQGNIGAVVHCYPEGAAFEVEFVTAGADPVAVLTSTPQDVRPLGSREILHARRLVPTH